MKKIANLLDKKKLASPASLDPETVFYVFRQIIKEEYGRQGAENIKPVFLKDGKITIDVKTSNWANEISSNRNMIVQKVNQQIGSDAILDLAITQG